MIDALVAILVALAGLAPGELPPPPGATTDPTGAAWRPAGDYYDPPGPIDYQPPEPEPAPSPLDGIPQAFVDTADDVAQCESGGRWDLNVGTYDGGLQYLPGTWDGAAPPDYPRPAWAASREQQIAVTWQLTREGTTWRAFPGCARRLGLPR